MAVYRRIRDLREDHDLTQSALAAQLGLPQRSYSYYETGQHMMPLEILRALARFYGVSTDYPSVKAVSFSITALSSFSRTSTVASTEAPKAVSSVIWGRPFRAWFTRSHRG